MTTARCDRALLEAALLELPDAWMMLSDLQAGGAKADYLALHPQRGIALIDLAPAPRDPVPPLRALLEREAFARFFPGDLPIVHLEITAGDGRELEHQIAEAFARERPLAMCDDEWPDAIAALVSACDPRATWYAPTGEARAREAEADEALSTCIACEPEFRGPAPRNADPRGAVDPGPEPWNETAREIAAWRKTPRDLAPRMPRFQTVAAFLSICAMTSLWLSLPADTPAPHKSPSVEVAVAPQAEEGPSLAAPASPVRATPPEPTLAAPTPEPPPMPVVVDAPPPTPLPPTPPEARLAAASPLEMPPLPRITLAAAPSASSAWAARSQRSPSPTPAREVALETPPPPPRLVIEAHPQPVPELPPAPIAVAPRAPRLQPVASVADLVQRNCRPFNSRFSVVGTATNVRGLACQTSDGSWEIVSEAPSPH